MSSDGMQNRIPAGAVTAAGRYVIDLTGPHSHTLVMKAGVGSLSIGPPACGSKADLHVAADQRPDWRVFDAFAVPSGSPWPRWLHYTGGDAGFFDWARLRPIEKVTWCALLPADSVVDAGRSQVQCLSVHMDEPGGHLRLTLPARSVSPHLSLTLTGDLSRFSVDGDVPPFLQLAPRTGRRRTNAPFHLPDMGTLQQTEHLSLRNDPLGQPVSLQCLAHFPHLRSLSLWGNFCDLEQLAAQPRLEALGLRYMPDLGGLPALHCWPALETFIASNVEEATGKRLRGQLKARAAARPFGGHALISQLRKRDWWEVEFGRPFSAWPPRLAKLANEAFDAALAALSSAHDLAEAEAAITAFAVRFNGLRGIETAEREAVAEAVWQLSQADSMTRLGGTESHARQWFNEARSY